MSKEVMIGAIVGPTCSGKTSVLSGVEQRLDPAPAVLHFDAYDLYPSGSEAMEWEKVVKKIKNWEDPKLFDMEAFVADLGRLARGETVTIQTRDRESIARGETETTIVPAELTVVEGLFVLLDPRAREVIDRSFYLEVPNEDMVRRRLQRVREYEAEHGPSDDPWDQPEYIEGPMVEGTERFVRPQKEFAHVSMDTSALPSGVIAGVIASSLQSLIA